MKRALLLGAVVSIFVAIAVSFFIFPFVRDFPGATGDGSMFRGEETQITLLIAGAFAVLLWVLLVVVLSSARVLARWRGR